MENLPVYLTTTFVLTTFATLLLFINAVKNTDSPIVRGNSVKIFAGLTTWLIIQALLTLAGIYSTNTNSLPPKIVLFGILPAVVTIAILFSTSRGKQFIDSLPLKHLTYLNVVRIPVELLLFWLYLNKAVPQLMTFEGCNFDILAGVTAPLVAYFGFTKQKISRTFLLIWNLVCLGLLVNIVVIAFLSAPSLLQQFAFDQPNLAISRFPFSWLPTFIVPVVLFGHLVSIRQLLKGKSVFF